MHQTSLNPVARLLFVTCAAGAILAGRANAAPLPGTWSPEYHPPTAVIQNVQGPDGGFYPSETFPLTISGPVGVSAANPLTVSLAATVLAKPAGVTDAQALGFVSTSSSTLTFTSDFQQVTVNVTVQVPAGSPPGSYSWNIHINPASVPAAWTLVNDLGCTINGTVTPPPPPPVKPVIANLLPADGATYTYTGTPLTVDIAYDATVATGGAPIESVAVFFDGIPLSFSVTGLNSNSAHITATKTGLTDSRIHTIKVSATNTAGTAEATIHINVQGPPKITSRSDATFTVGQSGTAQVVTAQGFPTPTLSITAGTLPQGVTLSTSTTTDSTTGIATVTGALSGTPATAAGSPSSLTLTATNGISPDASAPVTVTVNKATPTVTWANPAAITYGTALSSTQLNATANVPGTFTYTPAAGTVLAAGTQTLSTSFVPANTTDYNSPVTASVSLLVNKASLTVKADNQTRTYGTANPTFTATITGFVNNETLATSGVTGSPAVTCSATTASNAGTYPIVPALGTLAAGNYSFTFANGTLTVTKADQTITFGALPVKTVGDPAFAPAATASSGLAVSYTSSNPAVATVSGGTVTIVGAGTTTITASQAGDTNYNAAPPVSQTLTVQPGSGPTCGTAIVRHGPDLNGNAIVDGSLQVLLPEKFALDGNVAISHDLLVVGLPTIKSDGHPTVGAVVDGSGSALPANYAIKLNGNDVVGRIVRRTDAVAIPVIATPPVSTGTRDVKLNSADDSAGDFATVRDLRANGNAGQVAVPPGTYRDLTADGNSGFTLGVPGATRPAVYYVRSLKLSGKGALEIVGPVILTVTDDVKFDGTVGSSSHPEWLTLNLYSGDLTLNGQTHLYASVLAPFGTVRLDGWGTLCGGLICDELTINGNGLLDLCGCTDARR